LVNEISLYYDARSKEHQNEDIWVYEERGNKGVEITT